ncbi:hypothetical protein ACHAPV_007079 [Trichoderma viride]
MQFKTLFFAAALTAQSVFAMSSTQQGQVKQNEKDVQSEQSAQIHQLEALAHTFQSQRSQMDGILTLGAPILNASTIVGAITGLDTVLNTTTTAVANITAATLIQQLPTIITSLTNLTSYIVTNVGTIVSTPVIGVYSPVDQAAIFTALAQLTDANTAFINAFVGPNGLVNNSLLRGPIGVILNLIERTVVDLAGALIARIPAFAQQAQALLAQLHASLALTISF